MQQSGALCRRTSFYVLYFVSLVDVEQSLNQTHGNQLLYDRRALADRRRQRDLQAERDKQCAGWREPLVGAGDASATRELRAGHREQRVVIRRVQREE